VTQAPDFAFEYERLALGMRWVAGVDEVGRGPLAGPVGVAAVILDPDNIPEGLNDSKALTAERRIVLSQNILDSALGVAIAFGSVAEIDEFNIRGATLRAMARVLGALALRPDFALIDGRDVPEGLTCPARAVVGGDALCLSIAAASIVAKVARDALMTRLGGRHPEYGFASNAGYGTPAHILALARFGPTPHHRRSFKVKRLEGDARSVGVVGAD
jgi:ribonuclease HII